MIAESRFPDDLFEGSPETLAQLRGRVDATLGGSRPQY
jgi:hypothetical protein